MAEWDSQSDSFNMDTFDLDLDESVESITSSTPIAKTSKRRMKYSQSDKTKKTPTGLPHYPQAPPSIGTGPTGDPLFATESPTTPHLHTDFLRNFGDLYDDDDFD